MSRCCYLIWAYRNLPMTCTSGAHLQMEEEVAAACLPTFPALRFCYSLDYSGLGSQWISLWRLRRRWGGSRCTLVTGWRVPAASRSEWTCWVRTGSRASCSLLSGCWSSILALSRGLGLSMATPDFEAWDGAVRASSAALVEPDS